MVLTNQSTTIQCFKTSYRTFDTNLLVSKSRLNTHTNYTIFVKYDTQNSTYIFQLWNQVPTHTPFSTQSFSWSSIYFSRDDIWSKTTSRFGFDSPFANSLNLDTSRLRHQSSTTTLGSTALALSNSFWSSCFFVKYGECFVLKCVCM